jgi:ubiquitin-protein ligase
VTSPRLRRLAADYDAVRTEYSGHPHLSVHPLGPLPPTAYRVEFRLRGLVLNGATPAVVTQHAVEIRLALGYPREQPLVLPLTPLFHPNVSDDHYCIADYWSAGEPLPDIIAKVGDMIQWRVYNVHSPLNATAAYWAEQNPQLFPIGDVALRQAEVKIELRPRAGLLGETQLAGTDAAPVVLLREGQGP